MGENPDGEGPEGPLDFTSKGKREIIDVVISTYVPARVDEPETWAFSTMMTAFMGLALGRPEGRLAPYIEQALWTRIARVFTALREGRDPNAAYDVPLEDEAPRGAEEMLEATLSRSWRARV
jgi:hypothetical protein